MLRATRPYPKAPTSLFPGRRRGLQRLVLLALLGLLAACSTPRLTQGFDPEAFATMQGDAVTGRLRLPPGTDLNGSARMTLVEGTLGDDSAPGSAFDLKRVGTPFATSSGSIVLSFELHPKDFARYDRATARLSKRISDDQSAAIRLQYRLCHRAGVPVSPPYVVGFLMLGEAEQPIYLSEIAVPPDVAKSRLPFCI